MLSLGFHSGRKKARVSGKSLAGELLQQCVMGIDKCSIPDCFSPSFLTSKVRVRCAVTNVKVKLRGTLVWLDSRISLLQEKLQTYRWF